jgi:signal transduction histidine kinase
VNNSLSLHELIHEMRNELAVARANLEGLVDGKLVPTRERLLGILQALSQLEALVEDVRACEPDVTMPVRPAQINVCELLDHEYGAMEAVARARGVAVSVQRCAVPTAECLHFYGDAARIGQIVKNVLLNAIRYTPKGGVVKVDCSRRADHLEVRISDSGPGISEREREQVFQPGFRGAAAAGTPGSGYGLAVVKELVEAQGGTITASAASPHGASFSVRLPGTVPGDDSLCASCRSARIEDRSDPTGPKS